MIAWQHKNTLYIQTGEVILECKLFDGAFMANAEISILPQHINYKQGFSNQIYGHWASTVKSSNFNSDYIISLQNGSFGGYFKGIPNLYHKLNIETELNKNGNNQLTLQLNSFLKYNDNIFGIRLINARFGYDE